MANDPTPGAKPFPSAKGGASDDDIFAEMGRMLAGDQLGAPPSKPSASADAPLELTDVVRPGKPMPAKPASPPGVSAAPAVGAAATAVATAAAKPAAPAAAAPRPTGTTVAEAAAMLDRQPKPAGGVTVSNQSLDALVQDLARPMIQNWISQNLERIVREEAAKAVAKAAPKA